MVLQAALFYLPYKVHSSCVQQSSKITFLCPKWIHIQPHHQVWFFLEGGLIGNFGRDGKAPVSWPKPKTALFFIHFLIKISFSTRWWSVWSAVTTTGWWWRRLSRSSSSTSSPSSITTPGTLSTLSHVGRLIAYHIKRCQSLPLFIDSKKNTFLSNLWLCTWSKFCPSWNTFQPSVFKASLQTFYFLASKYISPISSWTRNLHGKRENQNYWR